MLTIIMTALIVYTILTMCLPDHSYLWTKGMWELTEENFTYDNNPILHPMVDKAGNHIVIELDDMIHELDHEILMVQLDRAIRMNQINMAKVNRRMHTRHVVLMAILSPEGETNDNDPPKGQGLRLMA